MQKESSVRFYESAGSLFLLHKKSSGSKRKIHCFGFPIVLLGTIFVSILTFFIFSFFLFSSIYAEVVSLHGIKFQPFISQASDDFSLSLSEEKFKLWRPLVFLIISGIILIVLFIFYILLYIDLAPYYQLFSYFVSLIFIFELFVFVYSLLGFNQKDSKNNSLEDTKEEIIIEKEEIVENQD